MIIPEFKTLINRDRGSAGDYRGDKKLKATKEFTFIYFYIDPRSPIENWEDHLKREEALRYSGLEEKDIDKEVMEALDYYQKLLHKVAPSLHLMRSVKQSITALSDYYNTVNFSEVDNRGVLKHNPNTYINGLKNLGVAHDAVEKFESKVMAELKAGDVAVRGDVELGGNEARPRKSWNEGTHDAPVNNRYEEHLEEEDTEHTS